MLDEQVSGDSTYYSNLQELKELLLTSWCQIAQQTFSGHVVMSIPVWVRLGATFLGPAQY